jgi:RND family efflux transporter MFP subunit
MVAEKVSASVVHFHGRGCAMRQNSFPHLVATLAFVIAFVGVAGCSREKTFEKPAVPVKTQVVEASVPESGLKYSATLAPREQVDLAFKVGGYVEEILKLPGPDTIPRDVQKGDHVDKGVTVASLRDNDYQVKLNQARSAHEEAKAALGQATREFERAERLMEAGVLAKNEYDKAKEKLDVTTARLNGAESQVEEAQIQLQDTVLRSPLSCVVVSRFIERGTLVAPGTRAFILEDLSSVKAVFGVPDYVLKEIKLGETLVTTVEAFRNKLFSGTVTAISPSADPKSRVFEVEITIVNPGLELKDGMVATVTLDALTREAATPTAPLHAIVRPPQNPRGFMVFVVEERDGICHAHGRNVEIGRVLGNKVAVTDGLAVGERIITRGATLVYEGAVVQIIP